MHCLDFFLLRLFPFPFSFFYFSILFDVAMRHCIFPVPHPSPNLKIYIDCVYLLLALLIIPVCVDSFFSLTVSILC